MDYPKLIYDGDCGFCKRWVHYALALCDNRIYAVAYQSLEKPENGLAEADFKKRVYFLKTSEDSFSGAKAIFEVLAFGGKKMGLWLYHRVPGFSWLSETVYDWVAAHRGLSSKITWLFYGNISSPTSYRISSSIFLKGMAAIYFLAFFSLANQVNGLFSSGGILPIADFMGRVAAAEWTVWKFPTLFWLSTSDSFLIACAVLGIIMSVTAFLGLYQGFSFLMLWFLYLSFVLVGQDFLSFQWDVLLLEIGFVTLFFAPWIMFKRKSVSEPSFLLILLFRWMLFRVMFSSGLVKILSGDMTWKNLKALDFHFYTQPLPHIFSWFAHMVPTQLDSVAVWIVFVIQLICPWFIWLPGRAKLLAFFPIVLLESLIFFTGNYGFFNLLVLVLCILLIGDHYWPKTSEPQTRLTKPYPMKSGLFVLVFLLSFCSSLSIEVSRFLNPKLLPNVVHSIRDLTSTFRLASGYGLFAVMTTQRNEIVVEGSFDGRVWLSYDFKYKPGPLDRAPVWIQPHQPRLDWQMWFASLRPFNAQSWFARFMVKLLQNSPEVTALLRDNPFPDLPPNFVRAKFYSYEFTTWKERKKTGNWWKRKELADYSPRLWLK